MTEARCPKCHVEVGATWRWCLACGYDPDNSAQRVRQAAIEARQREGGWLPVVIVLIGLLIGGTILWRTTPDDTTLPTVGPSTAAEVTSWVSFSPPGGGFHVDLPSLPASTPPAQSTGTGAETFAVGAAGHLFTVAVGAAPPGLAPGRDDAGVERALRARAAELAASFSGSLASADPTSVDGVPALDVEIGDAVIGAVRARIVLVGTHLCTVTISGRELSDEIVGHVLGSFTVG